MHCTVPTAGATCSRCRCGGSSGGWRGTVTTSAASASLTRLVTRKSHQPRRSVVAPSCAHHVRASARSVAPHCTKPTAGTPRVPTAAARCCQLRRRVELLSQLQVHAPTGDALHDADCGSTSSTAAARCCPRVYSREYRGGSGSSGGSATMRHVRERVRVHAQQQCTAR